MDYNNLFEMSKEPWGEYLNSITESNTIFEINQYFQTKMLIENEKFFNKGNSAAGRRARKYAQKIKDVLQRYRDLILETNND